MEDFNSTTTSQDKRYYGNVTSDNGSDRNVIMDVVTCVVIFIGLSLTLVAIYTLYSLVRKDHVAPVYVINLLISDLIQLCCLIIWMSPHVGQKTAKIGSFFNILSLMASVGFMVCIALERYLVIARPLWYRLRRTIKISVVVCVMVWVVPLVLLLTLYFWVDFKVRIKIYCAFLLFPLPLFIFSLGGSLKALSASRVPSDEKRRIVAILVSVLLIYTLIFLPTSIWHLAEGDVYNSTLNKWSFMLIQFNPLADLFLYIFMRKGIIDKLLASVCCCRMDSNDISAVESYE